MQITPHIHVLNIPFKVPLPSGPVERSVNVLLICTDTITLVDSGTAGAEVTIFDYILSIGRQPEEIELLMLTHSHPDHIGAAQAIVNATGCQVAAHSTERDWIEDVSLQGQVRPVPGFSSLVGGSVQVSKVISEGDSIDVGNGLTLETLHTPGHSHGSLSFRCDKEKVLITGDAIPVPDEMPIFESYHNSLESLARLRGFGAQVLVSAWEKPLKDREILNRFSTSYDWLVKIHAAVRTLTATSGSSEPMDLCAQVIAILGLPPFAVNPLVARTLQACAENR
jgi:glyoxylase-like metal-dependent hydrolase (beta-lactamase superfamily II)